MGAFLKGDGAFLKGDGADCSVPLSFSTLSLITLLKVHLSSF
jgi:hypothetical protein